MEQITVGSLFSGIGGLDLGLEQAGMKTVWQVEFDDWARGKLDENFPHTEKFTDVREVGKHNLSPVDIICGGFPCQDLSSAKRNAQGLAGEKSGLWSEYHRIICELRPRYILIENVPTLLNAGLDRLCCDLASIGYDAEWQTLRASAFGLPHSRNRLFIIAYPASVQPKLSQSQTGDSYQTVYPKKGNFRLRPAPNIYIEDIGRSFVEIPEHLRVDNGISFELSEIEAAIKGYGNAVCPPVAKWIGERIIEFDTNRPSE
jgi:DNA (cytosine-5)-methyltransferase 1